MAAGVAKTTDKGITMKNWLIALMLVVLAGATLYYVMVYGPFAEQAPPPPIPVVVVEQPDPESVLIEPVEEIIEIEPELETMDEIILPPLAESDSMVRIAPFWVSLSSPFFFCHFPGYWPATRHFGR